MVRVWLERKKAKRKEKKGKREKDRRARLNEATILSELVKALSTSSHDLSYTDSIELDGLEDLEDEGVPVLSRREDGGGGFDSCSERCRRGAEEDAVGAEGVEAGDQVVGDDATNMEGKKGSASRTKRREEWSGIARRT